MPTLLPACIPTTTLYVPRHEDMQRNLMKVTIIFKWLNEVQLYGNDTIATHGPKLFLAVGRTHNRTYASIPYCHNEIIPEILLRDCALHSDRCDCTLGAHHVKSCLRHCPS